MPVPEEDMTNFKLNFLKEQLGRLDTNALRTSYCVDELQSKSYGGNSIDNKHLNNSLITDVTNCNLPIKMIVNQENYKNKSSSDNRESYKEQTLQNAELEKYEVNNILKKISKMGPQVYKDVLNYLKKRLDTKEHEQLCYGSDKEVTNSSNYNFNSETSSSFCSENDDDEEEEVTYVKEAFVNENLEVVDTHCRKDSISYTSFDCGENKVLDEVSGNPNISSKIEDLNIVENLQSKTSSNDSLIEMQTNADDIPTKYIIDVMKTEKSTLDVKKVVSEDVQEKHDTEKADIYLQRMEYAECQDIYSILDSEPLSKVSYCSFRPLPLTSCFIPTVESVYKDKHCFSPSSIESVSFGQNRLSLDCLVPRNFCHRCNIFASRQTNTPSVYFSEIASLTEELFLNVETKACNVKTFSDLIDLNVCNFSLSKKFESKKDVFEMLNIWRQITDNESKSDSKNESFENERKIEENLAMYDEYEQRIDLESSLEELKHQKCTVNQNGVQKEKIKDDFEKMLSLPGYMRSGNIDEVSLLPNSMMDDNFGKVSSMPNYTMDDNDEVLSLANSTKDDDFEVSLLPSIPKYALEEETKDTYEYIRDLGEHFELHHIVETEYDYSCRDFADFECGFINSLPEETVESFEEMKDYKNKTDYRDKQDKTENIFKRLMGPEEKNECRDMQKNSIRRMQDPDIRVDSIYLQEEETNKDKRGELKHIECKPPSREIKQHEYSCKNDDFEILPQDQNCHFGVKKRIDHDWKRGKEVQLGKLGKNQDKEQSLQENCQRDNWLDKHRESLFPSTSKRKGQQRKQGYLTKTDKFEKTPGDNISKATVIQKKIDRNGRKGKQMNRRNHAKFKREKPTIKTDFSEGGMQYFQKNGSSIKKKLSKHFEKLEGNLLHINGEPPIRLHLVHAKVCSRSGGEGGNRNNDRGSSGVQGDGKESPSRGGSSRQNSNGNGSSSGDGDGNRNNGNNNHNNNHFNKSSSSQKDNSKNKKIKNAANKTLSNANPMETGTYGSRETTSKLPEHLTSSPSLPTPKLDPEHIAERLTVEITRQPPNINHSPPSGSTFPANPNDGFEAASIQKFLQEEEEEAPTIQHAVVSIDQLCDVIGDATHGLPIVLDHNINICLSRLAHDLTLAASDDRKETSFDCTVCLIISQMLIHLADPEHDGFPRSCEQCDQIFNLMMKHCIGCIENKRPRSRLTQSDLCYKICRYSQWNVGQLNLSVNRLKSKVQKYCDKVLGSIADMVPLDDKDIEVMGEIGVTTHSDMPSTGLSSSTTLSLNGNIVAVETGEPVYLQTQLEDVQHSHGPGTVPFGSPPISSIATSSTAVVSPNNTASGCTGTDFTGHARLSRKSSQQKKTPAIPPPIVEENHQLDTNLSASSVTNTNEGDDIKNLIYQRWGSATDDSNDTDRTYGNSNLYGSLPLRNLHDVAQFFSVVTRPSGVPGIGEVVFGYPSQLKTVASFWDKKREECERTHNCPYQHREEGVILADQKENFSILHTRYQKHHQWERVSHLGNGMSGKCHLAIDLETNFKFCCKKIHLLKYTEEELSLWSEMHNAYVVRLYGAIRHGVKIYIFSEFIDGGSLAACIEEQKRLGRRLSHWSAINYFQQLLKVLAFLQKKNILHEDIKADNILLRRNSTYLALTDFGTSRRLQDPKELKNKSPVGSPTHWSPEKATMEGHGFPSDLWASVCVLVHMLSGEPPWVKRFIQKAAILNFIIYTRSPPMEDVPDNVQVVVRNLIERGFVKDPQTRPSSSELLRHPAFSILDEGTPETYFSTLTSMAHSGLRGIRRDAQASEQQDARKEEPVTNTLVPASSEAAVLYQTKVIKGQCQESDSRPDNRNQQQSEMMTSNNHNDLNKTSSKRQEENSNEVKENDQKGIKSNTAKNDGQALGSQGENAKLGQSSVPTENVQAGWVNKKDSKVHQLLGPLDINNLLPQFDELFVSGDSINTQSIKSFFADVYVTGDLSDARQSTLEVYKPEERTDELPNLSIFNASWDPTFQQKSVVPIVAPENMIQNTSQIDESAAVMNPPFRSRFRESPAHLQSPMHFTLSSESDDCTSADLFELEPASKNSDTVQNVSSLVDTHARNEASDKSKQNVSHLGDVSPTISTSSTYSSSGTSNLQQRKPTNLTLKVACEPLPPVMSHSQSDNQVFSTTSANEIQQKQRASTWSQLSFAPSSHHSGNTPSSSHATSVTRKISGTSVPSTASSGHSQFSYNRSSVIEEQERMLVEFTSDNIDYSPTSSESNKSSYVDFQQQDLTYRETSEIEDNTDTQTLRNTMLEEIDESKLVGHSLKFYDDQDKHLFTMLIEESPIYWKRLINRVRQKISQCGYNHFCIYHMNNMQVKFRHPLTACDLRVVRMQASWAHCWCNECYNM